METLSSSFAIFSDVSFLIKDEKEGAGKLKAEKSLASDRVKKQFSFIVDADDKNC